MQSFSQCDSRVNLSFYLTYGDYITNRIHTFWLTESIRTDTVKYTSQRWPVWPDLATYWTLGNFLKAVATITLPKSPTFLGNFCKIVKKNNFSSEIIFGQLKRHPGKAYVINKF